MLKTKETTVLEESAQYIFVPVNEAEYNRLVKLLDELIDIVRDDETHPLARMMDVVGVLVETYEKEHISEPEGDPIGALKHFMEEYNLQETDLPELGSQKEAAAILQRRRELNLTQIKALSKRFQVPASVFI